MSQGFDPVQKPYPDQSYPGQYPNQNITNEQNTVGMIGFVLSIVGLITCGVLCPLGFLLSFFGLFKQPKGLAIAGTIIGLIGTMLFTIVAIGVTMAFITVATTFAALGEFLMEEAAKYSPLFDAQREITVQWEDKDKLPTEAEGNELIEGKLDAWGNQIRYETNGDSYTLRSSGEDEVFDTSDDVSLGPIRENVRYDIDDIESLPEEVKKELEKQRKNQRENGFDWLPSPAEPSKENDADGKAADLPVSPLDADEIEKAAGNKKDEDKTEKKSKFGDLFKKNNPE